MTDSKTPQDPFQLDQNADLHTVLDAWQSATDRLQQTHEALRAEVTRLTNELEKKNRELARKKRLADLGQIASHIAHEVRNNLVPVTLYLSLLKRRIDADAGALDILEKIEGGFNDLNVMVTDLLNFTTERGPDRRTIDVHELVNEIFTSLAPQTAAQGIDVEIDVPRGETAVADRDMLRRAVLNLALNALDAMPTGGQIVVTSFNGPNGLELEIADSGPGLSRENMRKLFEPFYTTKPDGTGLGLAIVFRIAEVHGGNVTAMNCPEGGAAFTIRIPRLVKEAAA